MRENVLLVFSGLFGAVIGSFLNVCIFRLPRNCMSLVKPRSRCPRCLRLIRWFDNIPLASWIALGGRCRECGSPISPRYLAVEALTAALFLYAAFVQIHGAGAPGDRMVLFAVQAWFVSCLVVCTFIDLEFRILPDEITVSGMVIGLAASALFPALHPGRPAVIQDPHLASLAHSALGALLGGGVIYAVGILGKLVFRKEAMGFGDVKFMAMVGSVLGVRGVLLTFVLACLFGSVFGVGKWIALRRFGYVAFGPFLSAGALFMLFGSKLVERAVAAYLALFRSSPL